MLFRSGVVPRMDIHSCPCRSFFQDALDLSDELLTPAEAAPRLGITSTTLYDWFGRSRRNLLEIHGRRVTIEFFQTGAKAQGRGCFGGHKWIGGEARVQPTGWARVFRYASRSRRDVVARAKVRAMTSLRSKVRLTRLQPRALMILRALGVVDAKATGPNWWTNRRFAWGTLEVLSSDWVDSKIGLRRPRPDW